MLLNVCCHGYWPVSTSAMSMKWSSDAEANIFPSLLKLSVLTGQSSLQSEQPENKDPTFIQTFLWGQMVWRKRNTDWPGEAADTHQLLHVPQTNKSISASCGKVFPRGVELDAYTVGRVSVDGLDGLQIWITEHKTLWSFQIWSTEKNLLTQDLNSSSIRCKKKLLFKKIIQKNTKPRCITKKKTCQNTFIFSNLNGDILTKAKAILLHNYQIIN